MLNKTMIIGRLGGDPELKYTNSGSGVCNLSLATTEKWTNKDGDRQEKTEWHKVVIFGKSAEFAGEYAHKGSLVYVEGRLQTRSWEDREGNKRYTTEVVAQNFRLLDKRQDREEKGEETYESPNDESDVPF